MRITNKKIAKSKSSTAWVNRQAKDPYVARAQKEGWRARAVYKLIEINDKFKFLKNGQVVVDLGAAPGSWSQWLGLTYPKSRVIAMDLLEIAPLPNVEFYQGDFTDDAALAWLYDKIAEKKNSFETPPLRGSRDAKGGAVGGIKHIMIPPTESCEKATFDSPARGEFVSAANGKNDRSKAMVDVVLSDMAPNTTGHQKTDHLRQMVLLEYAFDFAKNTLRSGGTFVAKSFTGGATPDLIREMRGVFESVHHVKPDASRRDSVEMFVVGLGYRG